jgi:hypothetical protein
MNSDHIERWRDCLVARLNEQCGIAKQEAQMIADRWLRSAEGRPPALAMRHSLKDDDHRPPPQTTTRQTRVAT